MDKLRLTAGNGTLRRVVPFWLCHLQCSGCDSEVGRAFVIHKLKVSQAVFGGHVQAEEHVAEEELSNGLARVKTCMCVGTAQHMQVTGRKQRWGIGSWFMHIHSYVCTCACICVAW